MQKCKQFNKENHVFQKKNNESNKQWFNGYNLFDIFEYDKNGINIKSQQQLQYELDRIAVLM